MEMFNPLQSGDNIAQQESVIATITLNGLHFSQLPSHELVIYGSNGYLAYRNGNLYGKLKQTPSPTDQISSQNGSVSSGHDSMTSLSKENIFYLDDFEPALREDASGKPSLNSNTSLSAHKSHGWPEVYQKGIMYLVTAVRNAFFGEEQNLPFSGSFDESTTVHSMACSQVVQSSSSTSLKQEQVDEIRWIKEPVDKAANFDDGLYIQTVIEAVKQSSELQQWVRVGFVPLLEASLH